MGLNSGLGLRFGNCRGRGKLGTGICLFINWENEIKLLGTEIWEWEKSKLGLVLLDTSILALGVSNPLSQYLTVYFAATYSKFISEVKITKFRSIQKDWKELDKPFNEQYNNKK